MRFSEAIAALEEGKKIRNSEWIKGKWVSQEGADSDETIYYIPLDQMKDDWELYEEPKPTLTFAQVVEGLKQGKKFRRSSWSINRSISTVPVNPHIIISWTHDKETYPFSVEDFEATDWICVD